MENNKKNNRLKELKGSGYEITDDQPDIQGWPLYNSTHQKLGKVDDLLFDPQLRKVRYIVADLGGNDLDIDSREVLIPIGIAELHEKDDEVIVPNVTAEQLNALPVYNDDDLSDADEQEIFTTLSLGATAGVSGQSWNTENVYDRYAIEQFDDMNLYRNRNKEDKNQLADEQVMPVVGVNPAVDKKEMDKGRIRLRSQIVEEPVEQDISLKKDHTNIERRNVDRPASADSFREEEIEMELSEEAPVVNKEAREVEEVSLSREVTNEDATMRDTVGETDVDNERDGSFEDKKRR